MTESKTTSIDTSADEDNDFDEDFYDVDGSCNAGGLYDAGGHPAAERWTDLADELWDQEKDRRMFGD